jgi:hypothetical protein
MGILIGETIMRLNGNPQYSPPFPRGGQGFQANLDSLDVPANGSQLNIEVEHKDNSAIAWGSLGTFTPVTSTGLKTFSAIGCRENLRFKMWISAGVGPLPSDTFLFNMLSPNWIP